jgi:putative transcriptional regulator
MAAIHETMAALHEIDAVDAETMRRFGAVCLTPRRPSPAEKRQAIRERTRVRQGEK